METKAQKRKRYDDAVSKQNKQNNDTRMKTMPLSEVAQYDDVSSAKNQLKEAEKEYGDLAGSIPSWISRTVGQSMTANETILDASLMVPDDVQIITNKPVEDRTIEEINKLAEFKVLNKTYADSISNRYDEYLFKHGFWYFLKKVFPKMSLEGVAIIVMSISKDGTPYVTIADNGDVNQNGEYVTTDGRATFWTSYGLKPATMTIEADMETIKYSFSNEEGAISVADFNKDNNTKYQESIPNPFGFVPIWKMLNFITEDNTGKSDTYNAQAELTSLRWVWWRYNFEAVENKSQVFLEEARGAKGQSTEKQRLKKLRDNSRMMYALYAQNTRSQDPSAPKSKLFQRSEAVSVQTTEMQKQIKFLLELILEKAGLKNNQLDNGVKQITQLEVTVSRNSEILNLKDKQKTAEIVINDMLMKMFSVDKHLTIAPGSKISFHLVPRNIKNDLNMADYLATLKDNRWISDVEAVMTLFNVPKSIAERKMQEIIDQTEMVPYGRQTFSTTQAIVDSNTTVDGTGTGDDDTSNDSPPEAEQEDADV